MDTSALQIFQAATACSLLAVLLYMSGRATQERRRPPGPPGLPIVGNALDIPTDRQWLKFDDWRREYGDIIRITVLGQPQIILSSLKVAKDLLDSRGSIYSDRPPAVMAGELVGWNRGLGYPATQMQFRRAFHRFMGPKACEQAELREMLERENISLLRKLLEDPAEFSDHVRRRVACTSSTILAITYGYPSDAGDPLNLVKIAEDAMHGFALASEPGRWWVDSFPILKLIPPSFPYASFRREAQRMREVLDELYNVPFDYVKAQIYSRSFQPSFISSYLLENTHDAKGQRSLIPTDEVEQIAKAAGASLYSGGAETTPSALNSFFLAMTLYPDVQAKAQAEIDAAISSDVLPRISDRRDLPYVSALVKELWRWNPSVPLGLPHVASEDDMYMGHFIEKGSVVWANIWSIMHEETLFPDPSAFKPERFLSETPRSAEACEAIESSFGFGRRICPGMFLAQDSVFLAVATILRIFAISTMTDPTTNEEIIPEVHYDGFISILDIIASHIEITGSTDYNPEHDGVRWIEANSQSKSMDLMPQ
ncbi:cytochrome P450 [Cylindrobasidium torrendii FP15055 ss-10]|uniref:Cytochrome P450 n=1 Tax=Cylindrobasidium torrendii FP15055 ss-10 TaxID=1314674 RepID=A0A0D7B3I5_9AGAR|nr:cytochrome P450 [Cylindrobasidium torrendii FP15055 ss-10]